jgi:hypothetical protein
MNEAWIEQLVGREARDRELHLGARRLDLDVDRGDVDRGEPVGELLLRRRDPFGDRICRRCLRLALLEEDLGLRPELAPDVCERDQAGVPRPRFDSLRGLERVDRLGVPAIFGELFAAGPHLFPRFSPRPCRLERA